LLSAAPPQKQFHTPLLNGSKQNKSSEKFIIGAWMLENSTTKEWYYKKNYN
jgi:hypothetical protein